MTEISKICSGITSLKDIKCNREEEQNNVNSIYLHGNQINKIELGVLTKFKNLISLDLSSNNISKIEGLNELYHLKFLNLSNNKVILNKENYIIHIKYINKKI